MSLPIILLVGQAGSGKDTAANLIAKHHNAGVLAQADPMKRFAQKFFKFSEEQLWGPSSSRNAPDPRFAIDMFRANLFEDLHNNCGAWVSDVLAERERGGETTALIEWAAKLLGEASEEGFLTPRKMLQTLGTEWGRTYGHKDMWVSYATRVAYRLLGGGFSYDRISGLQHDPINKGHDYVVITDGRFRNELVGVKALGGKIFKIEAPDADGVSAETAGIKGHASEAEQRGLPNHWFDAVIVNNKAWGFEALEEVVNEVMHHFFFTLNRFEPTEAILERLSQTGG